MTTLDTAQRHLRFDDVTIQYDDSVLEPRLWTVLQSDWAVELEAGLPAGPMLELCCGAGHIGLAAAHRTGRRLVQVDANPAACDLARSNAATAGLSDAVTVRHLDLTETGAVTGRFALVLADPPYLPSAEVQDHPHDPVEAIDGGPDGLDLLAATVDIIDEVLAERGVALVQVRGAAQAAQLAERLPTSLELRSIREHDELRAVALIARSRSRTPGSAASAEASMPLRALLDEAMETDEARLWDDVDADRAGGPIDELATLLDVLDLWMAPVPSLRGREQFQLHPAVVTLKRDLEQRYLDRVRAAVADDGLAITDGVEAARAMRRIGAVELVPPIYTWLAEEAGWNQIVEFLALEGGPDAGFDDLVALAQVGIHDGPKVTLGANYWDEMGRGELAKVHTVLHDELVRASEMPRIAREDLPAAALDRMTLGGVLATNRSLQPELLGALGLLEMQAGPRCRAVVAALRRVDAPAGTLPFYEEHASADPGHGREWLDRVVEPLALRWADWGPRMVDGARWRHHVNHVFFASVRDHLDPGAS